MSEPIIVPWNESNPEWWKMQVEARGEHAWRWLVNEWDWLSAAAQPAALDVEQAVRIGYDAAMARRDFEDALRQVAAVTASDTRGMVDDFRALAEGEARAAERVTKGSSPDSEQVDSER